MIPPSQTNVYGDVPPYTIAVALPSSAPLHDTF